MKVLLIGSDPEMFLFSGGKPKSAIGIFPGSKENPYLISENESVQVDNVAIEFNLKPSPTSKELFDSMNTCYQWAIDLIKSVDPAGDIEIVASAIFDDDELWHPDSRRFGCDPDLNAWKRGFHRPPKSANPNLRSCGGHIHLGFDRDGIEKVLPDIKEQKRLVRLLDKHVGSYCSDICGDDRRRLLYGKAGSFRMKPYGIEYRTPSNKWLSKLEYMDEVYRLVALAVEDFNAGLDADISAMEYINNQTKEEVHV